ncbi:polymer-forming cytoskeletal protein [Parafrankia sp. BMG5.11]|uniref:bactofilin family protein n=1 Tax=Parafrankia sp. BMG5.11 TaxID=222540 RepID=UPI001038DCC4|nr:polymer-forming cytoskeletal protein [Parafrankia sp. BMG5.11]TCJ41060.1 polymer-forming cytoskeletal protein [Parafrankia sp. BMG5.11]
MFSKKPDEYNPTSQPVARPASGSTFSIIGSDVVIKGDVTASVDLHVDGRIEGDIQCASLVQGEGSHIEGGITAETARLAGTVSGSITARELVVLRSARINGDVHYDALTIEQGAEVEGRFAHRVPAKAVKADDGSAPTLTLAS